MTVENDIPNPGSEAAIKMGCICPVIDNNHGKGIEPGYFWMNANCPIHGTGRVMK
jgi:hypothetical protein